MLIMISIKLKSIEVYAGTNGAVKEPVQLS